MAHLSPRPETLRTALEGPFLGPISLSLFNVGSWGDLPSASFTRLSTPLLPPQVLCFLPRRTHMPETPALAARALLSPTSVPRLCPSPQVPGPCPASPNA